ncbi:putative alcohol dehydrogenase [Xylaria cf. heliscus]|nr:putative alcohol dehydrogenase [Xylaria cf. heliscus]
MAPATTKAVVVVQLREAAVREVLLPIVRPGWVLVKVKAVALNPTDWKHVAWGGADIGCRVGCDYAGIVEEVGDKVTNFKKGDRITGWIHGSNRANHESGSFAEYAIAKAVVQRKIPENMSFEEAATLGVAIMTVGQGMYNRLKLPLPTEPAKEPFPILIYGGSTAMGMAGIQFAKRSGLTVITTCSPHNFDLVKSLGADAAFDYKSPTCSADIRKHTNNGLKYSWDCTGEGAAVCAAAMSDSDEGSYGTIMPADLELLKQTNPKVHGQDFFRGYDTMGEWYCWVGETPIEPDQAEMEFYRSFLELTQPLLEDGRIKPLPAVLNKTGTGLDGVLKGLKEMEDGKISGKKFVYTL